MDGKKLSEVTGKEVYSLFERFMSSNASSVVVQAIALQTQLLHSMHLELLSRLPDRERE